MATLYYANQYVTTTLSKVGGLNATDTTGIVLASTDGVDTSNPGIALLSYQDPLDTSKAEWITYTSINGSKELVGVARAQEGSTAKTHSDGCAIAFPLSKSHINNINTAMVLEHDNTGHHSGVGIYNSLYRQALINGNFDVWQRAVTWTNPTTNTYTADRWYVGITNTGTLPTNIVHTRQALTAGDIFGSFYHYRVAPDGAGSGFGASDLYQIGQKIENGVRLLCGASKTVTVSFYARSTIANKKLGIYLVQNYGTGGSPTGAEVINGTNWTLTSSWTKYTYTFTTNTLASKTFGTANDDLLEIRLTMMWGSTTDARVGADGAETFVGSGNIDIAQVQLCAGDVALPFMPKSYEEEERACERYCWRRGGSASNTETTGWAVVYTDANNIDFGIQHPAMRTKPTLTLYGSIGTDYDVFNDGGAAQTFTSYSTQQTNGTNGGARFRIVKTSHGLGRAANFAFRTTSGYLILDAEL